MVQMSGSGAGYLHETIITPYMHALVFHVPTMIKMHGSLKHFSGQGIVSQQPLKWAMLTLNQKQAVYNHKFLLTRCRKEK